MQRPVPATVFGILNLLFGALGVLGLFGSAAMFSLPDTGHNPVLRLIKENPAYATWIKTSIGLGALSSIVLLISGIGLLFMKLWARMTAIGYSIFAMVLNLVGLVINYQFLLKPLLEDASQKSGPEAAGAVGGVIGVVFGGFFGMVYPIVLLIFMTRPRMVAAFRPSDPVSKLPPTP